MSFVDSRFADPASIDIPKCFGKYEYMRTIGFGSFSVVILVQSITDRKYYACKVVSRSLLHHLNMFDRFEQEARILAALDHPGIVHFQDIALTDDFIGIVMEYCPRGDLDTKIMSTGGLEESESRQYFFRIASAVEYIHTNNIAHRDLKPENILLDCNMNPKIADFGLCHVTSPTVLLHTPCGSPGYAAPEILSNKCYDGKKADVWSLGVLLYSMTTGSLPWNGSNQFEMVKQIEERSVNIPEHLSPSLRSLLASMLNRNPDERPSITKVLGSGWMAEGTSVVRSRAVSWDTVTAPRGMPRRLTLGSELSERIKPFRKGGKTTEANIPDDGLERRVADLLDALIRRVPGRPQVFPCPRPPSKLQGTGRLGKNPFRPQLA
jgi:serine/threonine protein kinase